MRRQQAGYSFYELMIILAIMAIVAAIATPGIISWLPKHRLRIAAQDVLSAMQAARARAIRENDRVTLNFDFANDSYTASLDDSTVVKSGRMPAGIDLEDVSLGAQVQFNKLGYADKSGSVSVSNNQGKTRVVELMVAGNSRIQ